MRPVGEAAIPQPEIEVDVVCNPDDDSDCTYFARGHVDRDAFCQAVGDCAASLGYYATGRPQSVKHAYMRTVPSRGEYDQLVYFQDKPGRGASPVTTLASEDCEEAQRCDCCDRWSLEGGWTEDDEHWQCADCTAKAREDGGPVG